MVASEKIAVCLIFLLSIIQNTVKGQDTTVIKPYIHETAGFLDLNGYYDTRNFSIATINILSKLPNRFEYFSLTNYQGGKGTSDLSSFYTEQNVRWKPLRKIPVNLTAQLVIRGGTSNDNVYLGFLWKPGDMRGLGPFLKKINLYYFINVHVVKLSEFDRPRYMRQLEHVYKLSVLPKLLHNRVYLAGFADQNIEYPGNGKVTFKWVTEHQLSVMLLSQFYIVAEYRINEFLLKEQSGVGYGLQYIIVY